MASEIRKRTNAKIRLEQEFISVIERLNLKTLRRFLREFSENRDGKPTDDDIDQWAEALFEHYEKTGDIFSRMVSPGLPADVAMTQEERDELDEALLIFYNERAPPFAVKINNTTSDNIDRAVSQALEATGAREAAGEVVTQRETAVFAAGILASLLKGRKTTIVTTETNNVAERASSMEVKVLMGFPADDDLPREAGVMKEWFTIIPKDDRIRDPHLAADRQRVDIAVPFVVGGQLLRFPGDNSLGASAENTINCRCSSIADTGSIIRNRRFRRAA